MNTAKRIALVISFAFLGAEGAAEPGVLDSGLLGEVSRESALPERLSQTGLYLPGSTVVRPELISFTPQYPLWSDGATKRRWLSLPPGTVIDGSQPNAWEFPIGTRLWKEFSHGQPIETRFIERLGDGSWRFASYVWDAAGEDALLAPSEGLPALAAPTASAARYAIPSRDDCLACHEGTAVPVLGFGALQLSPERDPLAPRAEQPGANDFDLEMLVARGLLSNLPQELIDHPPRIEAPSATARAALGYLHANCGHCHNDAGPLALLELNLAQSLGGELEAIAPTMQSLLNYSGDFRLENTNIRVAPGRPDTSVLALRMRSRNPLTQMPPLGTQIVDEEGIALIERWIRYDTKHIINGR